MLQSLSEVQDPSVELGVPHVLEVDTFENLKAIVESNYNLGIFRRDTSSLQAALAPYLSVFPSRMIERVDPRKDITSQMTNAFYVISGNDKPEALKLLFTDIVSLVQSFAGLTNSSELGVVFEKITTDCCRVFHVDRVGLRLISTYVGPGSKWLKNSNTHRDFLGCGDSSKIRREGSEIEQLKTGWVGVFKGESGQNIGNGIVHKSPAIEHLGISRLVLRIDTLD